MHSPDAVIFELGKVVRLTGWRKIMVRQGLVDLTRNYPISKILIIEGQISYYRL